MARYVVLSRLTSEGRQTASDRLRQGSAIADEVAASSGKVIEQFSVLGEWDFCSIVDLPDPGAAQLLGMAHAGKGGVERTVLAAIDLPLFIRLLGQTTETVGPHRWQISWPARWFRRLAQPRVITKYARHFFEPLTIAGKERLDGLREPVIFIANHASHLDTAALLLALPWRYRAHAYWGSAADRWFLKGREEWRKQGWWRSLAYAAFPIQRGGGSRSLDHAKWILRRGGSIVIFPEGTRTRSGKLGKFRIGPALLALDRMVPVVPIYMHGLRELLPSGGREARPGPVDIVIGEPIRFAEGTDPGEATQRLRTEMEALRAECLARGPPGETTGAHRGPSRDRGGQGRRSRGGQDGSHQPKRSRHPQSGRGVRSQGLAALHGR